MKEHVLLIALSICGSIIILYAGKKPKPLYFLLSALCGTASLIAADLICGFFDFDLPLNAFTLPVAAVGGIPGVILLNILCIVFGQR